MEAFFLTVNGAALACARQAAARPGLPTLVFLHEGLGCVEMWRDFPAAVGAATGCAVFVFSRQGYGQSDGKPPPWPLDYMHREALAVLPGLLDAAAIEDAVLVGHSDGASISLIHAGAVGGDRLRGVIALAPHIFNEDLSVTSIAAAKTAYVAGPLRDGLAAYHGANVDDAFWGWNGAWLDPGFRSWNITEYLPTIGVPVLVIQGLDDEYGTLAQVEGIVAGVPGGAVTVKLADCGHAPHRDQPAATQKAIADFLRRLT